MSIRDLAQQADVTTSTIVGIESGKHKARYETMRKIAAALQSEPSEIDEFREADEYWADRPKPTAPAPPERSEP